MDLRADIRDWYEGCDSTIDGVVRTITLPVALAALGVWEIAYSVRDLGYWHKALRKEKGYFSNLIRYYKDIDYKEAIDEVAEGIWRERDPLHAFASAGVEMLTDEYIKSEFKKMCESGKLDVHCPDNVPMWQIKKYEEVKQRLLEKLSDKYRDIFGEPPPDHK